MLTPIALEASTVLPTRSDSPLQWLLMEARLTSSPPSPRCSPWSLPDSFCLYECTRSGYFILAELYTASCCSLSSSVSKFRVVPCVRLFIQPNSVHNRCIHQTRWHFLSPFNLFFFEPLTFFLYLGIALLALDPNLGRLSDFRSLVSGQKLRTTPTPKYNINSPKTSFHK